jgi:glycine cleavage system H protein
MRFTETHEWIYLEKNDIGIIGITSFWKEELGEIVSIAFPNIGEKIKGQNLICVLESTKSAVDMYSPVSGKVIDINNDIKSDYKKINLFPQSQGWLCKIKLNDLAEYYSLMNKSEYESKFTN